MTEHALGGGGGLPPITATQSALAPPLLVAPAPAPPAPAPPPPPPSVVDPSWQRPVAATPVAATPVAATPVGYLAARSRFARNAILANLAAVALATFALWRRRQLLVDLREGEQITFSQADSADSFVRVGMVLFLLTFVVAMVAFLRWFSLAYRNLNAWTTSKHSSGWAIGSWFVPFLNFWRPFKIAEEIVVGSADRAPDTTPVVPRVMRVWWAAFLASGWVAQLTFGQSETVDDFVRTDTMAIVGNALRIVAGIAVLRIIRQVTRDQDARISGNRQHLI